MIIVNDLKTGTNFTYEGNIYYVISNEHNKTAMRQMVIKTKVRNMRTGVITDITFTGGDKVQDILVEKKDMQYLYDSGDSLTFMDNTTYEQVDIPKDRLKWEINFLKESDTVSMTMYEGEVLGIQLPDKVALKVTECENAVKGDTATSALKNAVCETGWEVKVPLFIEQDEMISISTIDGKYCGRAN